MERSFPSNGQARPCCSESDFMTVIFSIWLSAERDHFMMEGREYLVSEKQLEDG